MSSDALAAPTGETVGFAHLAIRFDSRVLRPRAWTARQSEWAHELLPTLPSGPVLELCAGVGHIGLLAVAAQRRDLVLVDLNPVACDFARLNAATASLTVDVREGPMDEVLDPDERFALIIADPPWVPSNSTGQFPEDPLIAIDGGHDGMTLAWTCLDVIAAHLAIGGAAILQLGTLGQAAQVDEHLLSRPEAGLRLLESREFDGRGVLVRLARD